MLGISLSVLIGVFFGFFFKNETLIEKSNYLVDLGLILLLFFVGIDIGKNSEIFKNLKRFGNSIWILPLAVVTGTLFGGAVASFFTTLSLGEAVTVSSGMGWYSLSAIKIGKVDAALGSVAFLSNVFRELLAIFIIPFVAKRIGHLEAVATGGAPAMDTLLPIINKYTTSDVAVLAFSTGVILSSMVPILVTLLITVFKIG